MSRRRCDARCHNSKGHRCKCWCRGRFHGVRGTGARMNLRYVLGLRKNEPLPPRTEDDERQLTLFAGPR